MQTFDLIKTSNYCWLPLDQNAAIAELRIYALEMLDVLQNGSVCVCVCLKLG